MTGTRIVFVSTSTTVGGAEKTLYTLATLLDPRKFTVAGVVSLKSPGAYAQRLSAQGVDVRSLDTGKTPSPAHAQELANILDELKPDIVHAFMYQAIQLCRIAKKRAARRFKLVSSPRVNYRSRTAWSLLVDLWLKRADDLLISECEASREYLLRRLWYNPARVKTIYNGVDIAQWPVSKLERQQKRLELRLGAQDILIGSIGRLDAQKGHEYLIEALALLKTRYPVRCAILGEGPQRPVLEKLIRKLNLERHVWLLGERPDVVHWLSSFDLFALPSLWEGLPNALLEAMALGLPVVASSVDGIPEALRDGQSGLLVPPKDAAALARKMAQLLDDPGLKSRLGEGAKAAITERFKLIDMIANYESAYAHLI
ncbi:MAG: glycosyltransferase [Elusimicrobia bacterium]|nr:glycosyltransferase [Elusimicrobiota bacterium]